MIMETILLLAFNGVLLVNNGFLIQGGIFTPNGGVITINFPVSFGNNIYFVFTMSDCDDTNGYIHYEGAYSITNSKFKTRWNNTINTRRWIACGY